MSYKNRLNPLKMIFLIKVGQTVKKDSSDNCYRVNKLISFFFHLYYSGLFLFVFFLIFHYVDLVLGNNVVSLIVAFILYITLEILIAMIVPLQKMKCTE